MARTSKPRAPKPIPPDRVDAAYVDVGKRKPISICPKCWSRPSVTGRIIKEAQSEGKRSRKETWTITAVPVKVGSQVHSGWEMWYPCSNPACHTHLRVVGMTLVDTEITHPVVIRGLLTAARATEYKEGKTLDNGIWVGNAVLEAEEISAFYASQAEGFKAQKQYAEATKARRKRSTELTAVTQPAPISPERRVQPVVAAAPPEPQKSQRKPRSDKGKKRGSKMEPAIIVAKARKPRSDKGQPRGPRNIPALKPAPAGTKPQKRGRKAA